MLKKKNQEYQLTKFSPNLNFLFIIMIVMITKRERERDGNKSKWGRKSAKYEEKWGGVCKCLRDLFGKKKLMVFF